MNYIKAKYPNQSRSYIFATSDDVKAGDMVVNAKGAKLKVTDESVDMKWVDTYGADKVAVVKKCEEPEKRYIVEREFEHAGDRPDYEYAIKQFPKRRDELERILDIQNQCHYDGDVIRTEEYVAEECKKLAEQLKEFEESEE